MNIRTCITVITFAMALAVFASHNEARAQEYEHGAELQNCVSTYYDRGFYGWLAIRNSCATPITVAFVGGTGGNSGTLTLSAGTHASTGYSQAEWTAVGGIYYAVCHADYYPIETNRRIWLHAGQPFLCMRR